MANRGRPKKNIEDNINSKEDSPKKQGDICPNCGVGKLQIQMHVLRCTKCAAWYPNPAFKDKTDELKEENESLKRQISENQIKAENNQLKREIEELKKINSKTKVSYDPIIKE